ncbi:hypothetical protein [Saccharibacillus sacchari]|uniref:Uncharacterized protein n=1 Tax=Saccharibacillus sacchari TaxID=456493 RepID=A0ACC6P763_9BACL
MRKGSDTREFTDCFGDPVRGGSLGAAGEIRFGRVLHLGSWIGFYKGSFPNTKANADAPALNFSLRLALTRKRIFNSTQIRSCFKGEEKEEKKEEKSTSYKKQAKRKRRERS